MKDENTAKVNGKSLNISSKQAMEICSFIRNKNLQEAKKILSEVVLLRYSIPFKRFNDNLSHKKKKGPARYPVKAAKEINKLLESAEANAQFKGLSKDLVIKHVKADFASRPWHSGRQRRIKMKRTNIELIVEEAKKEEPEKKGREVKK